MPPTNVWCVMITMRIHGIGGHSVCKAKPTLARRRLYSQYREYGGIRMKTNGYVVAYCVWYSMCWRVLCQLLCLSRLVGENIFRDFSINPPLSPSYAHIQSGTRFLLAKSPAARQVEYHIFQTVDRRVRCRRTAEPDGDGGHASARVNKTINPAGSRVNASAGP